MSATETGLRSFSSYSLHSLMPTPPANNRAQIDAAVERLHEGARRFARLGINERIALAEGMQRGVLRTAERSVAAGCRAKGIALGTPLEAEEWATGPWGVVRQLRLIREQLSAIARTGTTRIGNLGHTSDGRLSVNVFLAMP